jgi:O-antigen biosynthesis protein
MKLSVIIVNYNVKFFLENCLYSVIKACKNIDSEIIVIDNNSVDGSVALVKHKFPSVRLIENKQNYGFSYANNQAISVIKGEYLLLLNPDTLVEENTFIKILEFMDSKPQAGALGVKMIDGKGNFLPESKRSLPTPSVAFFKIFGFSKLFPKSKTFNKYHLAYLPNDQVHEVDVLAGAFMMIRKKVLDEIGPLDDQFFMYGEDIDISYRIIKAGYKNYYFPHTTIVHYKGESTKKGSLNYVVLFYQAMLKFARKHYNSKNTRIFSVLVALAIFFRAGLSVVNRLIMKLILPLLDSVLIYLTFYFIIKSWEYVRFPEGGNYPDLFTYIIVPVYLIIWILSISFAGGYSWPIKPGKIVKGFIFGSVLILVFYSLLPEYYRFSRLITFLGAVISMGVVIFARFLLNLTKGGYFKFEGSISKRIIIIGYENEFKRVSDYIKRIQIKAEIIGFVSLSIKNNTEEFLGTIDQLKEIVRLNRSNEVIFCSKDISWELIIKKMLDLSDMSVNFKIASPDSFSIIGSNSINSAGELYVISINSVSKESNKRKKRLLDVAVSLFFMIFSIVIMLFVKNKIRFLYNSFIVLKGSYSWVGYFNIKEDDQLELPFLKKGILSPVDAISHDEKEILDLRKVNTDYAKNYTMENDLFIIFSGLKNAGRKIENSKK